MMGEAFAVLWAIELTRIEMFQKVRIEGDVKVCFDALNDAHEFVNWAIAGIISNVFIYHVILSFLILLVG